jgi:catechol 1,2-dioxygenase
MEPMTEEALTEEVVARLDGTPDLRLREVMQALVRHLHAFAREVRLTDAEWIAGIGFLTETGQISDDVRQEFILLSDTLGLSSLVDLINNANATPGATETTILGPFYVPNSPQRAFGDSMIEFDDGGELTTVSGRVLGHDGSPIPNAVLDVWQNSANGFYAVQQPEVQPPTNLRGIFHTDQQGRYEFRTVRPKPYPIPADGPVGHLIDITGRHPWRAAHLHVKVSADGFRSLTTHVFDASSAYLDSDTVFGVKGSLVADFRPSGDGPLECSVDFVLTTDQS